MDEKGAAAGNNSNVACWTSSLPHYPPPHYATRCLPHPHLHRAAHIADTHIALPAWDANLGMNGWGTLEVHILGDLLQAQVHV